ncbi:MAG: 3-hydroxyacyl-CoA dehydrogenase NAD-binding domain-containing protein [Planctomycetota bacterium]
MVTVTIDMPDRAQNVINEDFGRGFQEVLEKIAAEDELAGVIITSAKKDFVAGGDIDHLYSQTDPKEVFEGVELMLAGQRMLETCGKPVVAAINGTALGGGLEIALTCHHRIALDDDRIKFGFPEVTLGILPGMGGIARMTRLIGLLASFPYLTEGKQIGPKKALEEGILDELATDRDDLMAKARAWIEANPEASQPWDQKGYRMPGGDSRHPKLMQLLVGAPVMLQKMTHYNYPAPLSIMSVAVKGSVVPIEVATRMASRNFAALVTGKVSKNMINSMWYQLNQVNGGASRPDGFDSSKVKKVGMLGAGMMGHGIAYVSAAVGIDVVLKDSTMEKAEEGKSRVKKILDWRVGKGRTTEDQANEIMDRILPTDKADDLKGCDLIIEAVFENRELKAKVTQEAEAQIADDAVFASNTSTLPITGLAEASARPANFIGLHFFSPVDRMRLVEIICGDKTSDETLARAFDYVFQIKKTPIVVNDSRGFYTSRVFGTYPQEGTALLYEGNDPSTIERAGRKAGMPVGPLALTDEVGITLSKSIRDQTISDLEAAGEEVNLPPHSQLLDVMVTEHGRGGKYEGAGFYEYPADGKKFLWPKLKELFQLKGEPVSFDEMIDRMLFVQSLETARCMQDGVLRSVADANIGSIFGWGYPPFNGGTLQFMNSYGLPEFVERSRELAAKYGERFEPPQILIDMAEKGETF